MSASYQPLEIVCEAPPYYIVQACWQIGLERPEDVRWLEVTHVLAEDGHHPTGDAGIRWNELLDAPAAKHLVCSCGRRYPYLMRYRFTFNDRATAHYSFGQCARCHTVYWHEG